MLAFSMNDQAAAFSQDIDLLLLHWSDTERSSEESEDIRGLLDTCLSYVGHLINISDLDSRALTESRVHIDRVRNILQALEGGSVSFGARDMTKVAEDIAALRGAIDRFETADREGGRQVAINALRWGVRSALDTVMQHIDSADPILARIEQEARESLSGLPDVDIMRLFAGVRDEFSSERVGEHFPEECPSVPPNFLRPSDVEEARSRLAHYVVRLRPALIREAIAAGRTSYPADAVGLAQILATSVTVPMSTGDRRALQLLSRLIDAWREPDRICRILALSEDSWLARKGRIISRASFLGRSSDLKQALVIMRRLLGYASLYVDPESRVERVFQGYKLGLELFYRPGDTDPLSDELAQLDELGLQRHLCRYLIEHDILSYGVQFGRSEIDLITNFGGGPLIIETKILRGDDDWPKIDVHLGQLRQYMDQHLGARGILVVYNRTGIMFDAPKRWIRGRFWILIINLCPLQPSKTKKHILISEDESKILRFEPNFDARSPRATR